MVHWIYLLQCENGIKYVGETIRLYTRLTNHFQSNGSKVTIENKPISVIGVYRLVTIKSFIDFNNYINGIHDKNVEIDYKHFFELRKKFNFKIYEKYNQKKIDGYLKTESEIVECMLMHNPFDFNNIKGGKYTNKKCNYKFPKRNDLLDLPLCDCGLPCDIKINRRNVIYFRCPKLNLFDHLKKTVPCDNKSCRYYKEYKKDQEIKSNYNGNRIGYLRTMEEDINIEFLKNLKDVTNTVQLKIPKCNLFNNISNIPNIHNTNIPNIHNTNIPKSNLFNIPNTPDILPNIPNIPNINKHK